MTTAGARRLASLPLQSPRAGRQVLGLVGGPSGPGLRELLSALADRCAPRAVDRLDADASALLCEGSVRGPTPDRPYAVWLRSGSDLESPLVPGARVLVTPHAELVRPGDGGPRIELVPLSRPPSGVPVGIEVRARLRRARGLDLAPVAAYEDGGWSWIDPDASIHARLADTVCGIAAAVVATSPAEGIRAMSWGAPTVLDPVTAHHLGATPGEDAAVADTPEARWASAVALAADQRRAARLAWAGRRLVEARHDLRWVARRIGDGLGLPARGVGPMALVDHALDAFDTPVAARIRGRAAVAFAGLPTDAGGPI